MALPSARWKRLSTSFGTAQCGLLDPAPVQPVSSFILVSPPKIAGRLSIGRASLTYTVFCEVLSTAGQEHQSALYR